MATIFQLRRGNDPASPSLVEGELYLNNAKGTIQFGSGSSVAPYGLLAMNVPMVGNVDLYGNLSASLPLGYTWVGGGSGRTILASTSSLGSTGYITAVGDTLNQIGIDLTVTTGTLTALASGLTTSSDVQFSSLGIGMVASATAGRIDASNDIVAFSTSDKRFKENITPIENALEKINQIGGYEFDWKEENKIEHGYEGHDLGVIAQEIESIAPELVQTRENGYKAVKYDKLVSVLIEAIKELSAKIDKLEKK